MNLTDVVNGAVGPYYEYCDGASNSGASGYGYISVLKLSTGKLKVNMDGVLDRIATNDKAASTGAYVGGINMLNATSFNGINGAVWGYHLAKADALSGHGAKPIALRKRHDGKRVPIYSLGPLVDAGERLFGVKDSRRFSILPGAFVPCAYQSVTAAGKDTNGLWCAFALAIADDRETASNLFIEDTGISIPAHNKKQAVAYFAQLTKMIVESILICGKDQDVKYKEIFIGYDFTFLRPDEIGCAAVCAPYVVLARNAIPGTGPASILDMTITEWEEALKLQPLRSA